MAVLLDDGRPQILSTATSELPSEARPRAVDRGGDARVTEEARADDDNGDESAATGMQSTVAPRIPEGVVGDGPNRAHGVGECVWHDSDVGHASRVSKVHLNSGPFACVPADGRRGNPLCHRRVRDEGCMVFVEGG